MPKGTPVNVYVPKEQVRLLDAIAEEMGRGDIGIRPTRSQLVVKAIENFIKVCQRQDNLRIVIDATGTLSQTEGLTGKSQSKNRRRLQVIAPAS
jgi:hypothetical protein